MINIESYGVENFVGKCMATILRGANNMTPYYNSVRLKTTQHFYNRPLPEVKLEKRTNVNSNARNKLEWNTIKCVVEGMIN
jgi:hypothetical protein